MINPYEVYQGILSSEQNRRIQAQQADIAAQQAPLQQESQQIGILQKVAQLRQAEQQRQATQGILSGGTPDIGRLGTAMIAGGNIAGYHLLAQDRLNKAQADKEQVQAAKDQQLAQNNQTRGALSDLLTTGGYYGTPDAAGATPPQSVEANATDALKAATERDARGERGWTAFPDPATALGLISKLPPSAGLAAIAKRISSPTAEPLVVVKGAQGDQYIPRSQAVGMAPGAKPSAVSAAPMDEGQLAAYGAQAASGEPLSQVVPGYGTAGTEQRKLVQAEAIKHIKAQTGMDDKQAGEELAQRSIDYAAGRRSTTQLNTMLGATRQAVQQLEFNVGKVNEELKKLPGSDLSPITNAIIRGEQKWTGDPRYSSLFYFMQATAMESARILQGGQASVAQLYQGAAEEARKWANINMTPKSFTEGVAPAILAEGKNRLETYSKAMEQQSVGANRYRQPQANAQPAPSAPMIGQVIDGHKFKGGDPSKQENWVKQ